MTCCIVRDGEREKSFEFHEGLELQEKLKDRHHRKQKHKNGGSNGNARQ